MRYTINPRRVAGTGSLAILAAAVLASGPSQAAPSTPDPRLALFPTKVDAVVDISQLDALLAAQAANPAAYDGMNVGVDMRSSKTAQLPAAAAAQHDGAAR